MQISPTAITGIATLLLFCGTIPQAQGRSLEEIKASKELRICLYADSPSLAITEPLDCRENCKFSGPVQEETEAFTQSLSAQLGLHLRSKYSRVTWEEQFFNQDGKTVREDSYTPKYLASGQCDFYPNRMTKNEWRLKKLDFVTLFPSRMLVIVNKSKKAQYKTAAVLAGKTTGIVKDTSYHGWIQEQNLTTYAANPIKIEFMSAQERLAALDEGKVDFTLLDSDTAVWVTRNQFKNTVVAFPVGQTDEIGWSFRKEDKDLQAAVQQFFDEQKKSEKSALNQIWFRNFGITLNKFIVLVKSTL